MQSGNDVSIAAGTLRGYPVRRREVDVAGRTYVVLGPANYESLVDDPRVIERFARDEFMPYWAEFWPAARVLAEEVARWEDVRASPSPPLVLELGCGLGLIGMVALSRGYRVLLSDYDEDALAFVRASAAANALPPPETRFVDWRESYPELRPDRILAAEVLYERRNLTPLAEFVREHLAPGGFALFCDNFRSVADGFPEAAQRAGLRVASRTAEVTLHPGRRIARARFFHVHNPR
jgi:SAM-dependent methyltransferase